MCFDADKTNILTHVNDAMLCDSVLISGLIGIAADKAGLRTGGMHKVLPRVVTPIPFRQAI